MAICFYVRRPHLEIVPLVMRSLEKYATIAGPALSAYGYEEGERPLDQAGWRYVRDKLLTRSITLVDLGTSGGRKNGYAFEYYGRPVGREVWNKATEICAMCFWLPTEYLEEHGPDRVRELALDLLGPLPICSGSVGLGFNVMWILDVRHAVPEFCLRYPGIDLPDMGNAASDLGTRLRGPSWLTLPGQPALGELGGVEGIRSQLHAPGTTVEALDGDRAMIRLGEWPEAGDLQEGRDLPAYRELARVLEPCLYREARPHYAGRFRSAEEFRRWERRFLD